MYYIAHINKGTHLAFDLVWPWNYVQTVVFIIPRLNMYTLKIWIYGSEVLIENVHRSLTWHWFGHYLIGFNSTLEYTD